MLLKKFWIWIWSLLCLSSHWGKTDWPQFSNYKLVWPPPPRTFLSGQFCVHGNMAGLPFLIAPPQTTHHTRCSSVYIIHLVFPPPRCPPLFLLDTCSQILQDLGQRNFLGGAFPGCLGEEVFFFSLHPMPGSAHPLKPRAAGGGVTCCVPVLGSVQASLGKGLLFRFSTGLNQW